MNGIWIDGREYDVRVKYNSLKRSFSFAEGSNGGVSLAKTQILDTIGTDYGYTMMVEPNPANRADYDAFFEAISNPDRMHIVKMTYGQSEMMFAAIINSGSDSYQGTIGGENRWGNLVVNFSPYEPQRRRE